VVPPLSAIGKQKGSHNVDFRNMIIVMTSNLSADIIVRDDILHNTAVTCAFAMSEMDAHNLPYNQRCNQVQVRANEDGHQRSSHAISVRCKGPFEMCSVWPQEHDRCYEYAEDAHEVDD